MLNFAASPDMKEAGSGLVFEPGFFRWAQTRRATAVLAAGKGGGQDWTLALACGSSHTNAGSLGGLMSHKQNLWQTGLMSFSLSRGKSFCTCRLILSRSLLPRPLSPAIIQVRLLTLAAWPELLCPGSGFFYSAGLDTPAVPCSFLLRQQENWQSSGT